MPRSVFSRLLFVWLAFSLMVFITFFFVSDIVHGYLVKEAENILSYTQSRITTDLREAETILQTVSQSVLIMILRGDSAQVIHEHLIEITDYLSSYDVRIAAFHGVYGFFTVFDSSSEGLFLDGSGWIPPDDYVPQERPWYKAAVAAGGKIAATTPYISLYPGEPVVSYARLIHDNEGKPLGVVSLDVRLDKMADYVVNTRLTEGGFGMLINENLEIIATFIQEHVGLHLTQLPDKDVMSVVEKLQNGINVLEHIVMDDQQEYDFVLFTKRLDNGWHIGILTPIDKYYQQVTNMRFFMVVLGIILAFTLSLVLLRMEKTKQKSDEESLEAKAASKAKGDFLATMSHEMRTPLNVIIGLSEIEMLEAPPREQNSGVHSPSEKSRNNIAQIHRCGTTLLEIVNDILDISKIEAGRFELYPHIYDSALMINDTTVLSRVRIGSMPINFKLEIEGNFPGKLIGDELRVKQILNNLLSNAIKYTRQGTVILGISFLPVDTAKHPKDSVIVRFSVQDTGIGIRQGDMNKLFTNYTQLDMGANRKTEGTGLGLPIVKNLAELMGGGITVKSEYGNGSCFTAEIVQGTNGTVTIGNETAEKLRSFKFADKREKEKIDFFCASETNVLVVDDIRANQTVMKGLLAPYELQIDTAFSGNEAIKLIKEREYDLVFMDHMMPEMDGVEVTAAIRTWEKEIDRRRIPIIAMTANAIHGMREFYLDNGFDDYISKPVIQQTLHEMLVKWIKTQPQLYTEKIKESAPVIPKSLSSLLAEQYIDVLRHYCVSFEGAAETDSEYYAKFAAYIKSMDAELIISVKDKAALLIEAGKREDRHAIREILPVFCDALQNLLEKKQFNKQETDQKIFKEKLPHLKDALLAEDIKSANAILGEIGRAELTDSGRELYIRLYDLLFDEKTEKALELIKEQIDD